MAKKKTKTLYLDGQYSKAGVDCPIRAKPSGEVQRQHDVFRGLGLIDQGEAQRRHVFRGLGMIDQGEAQRRQHSKAGRSPASVYGSMQHETCEVCTHL